MATTALPTTGWRLIHNGVTVLSLSGANSVVTTPNTIFDATKALCMAEIARLGLALPAKLTMDGPIDLPTAEQTQYDADASAAKAYTKLTALKAMTPAQVQAWVATNVTNLAQAQDAIATLAMAVSILARRL